MTVRWSAARGLPAGSPTPTEAPARAAVPDDSRGEGFAAGHESSLEEAYRRWGALVHTVAARTLGDAEEAKDVIQQVVDGARRSCANVDPRRGALKTWLLGITHRKVTDALTRPSRDARDVEGLASLAGSAQPSAPRPSRWRTTSC